MTDIRLATRAYLTGTTVDWLLRQSVSDSAEYRFKLHARYYFSNKYFGRRYYGPSHFDPSAQQLVHVLTVNDTGLIDETHELQTAIMVALGTDKLADADEVLPDPDSTDRRGWWGDFDAEGIWDGWPIGCKNWLLTRAKISDAISSEGATLERARLYTEEALQPFVDQRIASGYAVSARRSEIDRIEVLAIIYRGPLPEIELRFQAAWSDIKDPPPGEFRTS